MNPTSPRHIGVVGHGEAGLTPWSAQGTAERQARVADLAGVFGGRGTPSLARSADGRTGADRILATVRHEH